MTIRWWKLLFYCALLSISVLTEVLNPEAKQLFCTPLIVAPQNPQSSLDREK